MNGGYETAFIDSVSNQTWEYDPVANTFTVKTPSPNVQGGTASGIVNGHLLMAGGRTNPDATLDLTWDYDIAADTWTQRASLPTPKNVAGGAVAQGQLWSIGGGNPFTARSRRPTSSASTRARTPGPAAVADRSALVHGIRGGRQHADRGRRP